MPVQLGHSSSLFKGLPVQLGHSSSLFKVCQFNWVRVRLSSRVCQFNWVRVRLSSRVCQFNWATVRLSSRVCQFNWATVRLPSRVCQFNWATIRISSRVCQFNWVTDRLSSRVCQFNWDWYWLNRYTSLDHFQRFGVLSLIWGSHTADAYSRWERTRDWYAISRIWGDFRSKKSERPVCVCCILSARVSIYCNIKGPDQVILLAYITKSRLKCTWIYVCSMCKKSRRHFRTKIVVDKDYGKNLSKTATLKRPKMVFNTNYRLMLVKSIAECSKRAFCNTFDLH